MFIYLAIAYFFGKPQQKQGGSPPPLSVEAAAIQGQEEKFSSKCFTRQPDNQHIFLSVFEAEKPSREKPLHFTGVRNECFLL